jgi:hypothetical protein
MAISNDWQVINNLAYMAVINSSSQTVYFLNENSVKAIADTIGWEAVEISEYTNTLTDGSVSCSSANIWGIRPPADDEEYNICITIGRISTSTTAGLRFIVLSTGGISGNSTIGTPTSLLYLRPTSTGGFAFKRSDSTFVCVVDKFYNPKTDKTKWGLVYTSTTFIDLATGLSFTITTSNLSRTISGNVTLGQFVALKKLTAISSAGVFNAKSVYNAFVDYSIADKTVEIDSVMYRSIKTSAWGFYIALA